MSRSKPPNVALEQPFPLKDRFSKQVLPVLLVLFGLLIVLAGFGALTAMREIYLELAQRRAETIARSAGLDYPELWQTLMASDKAHEATLPPEAVAAIRQEADELKLMGLKVYNMRGKILFSLDAADIGKMEREDALHRALQSGNGTIVSKFITQDRQVYELYVPILGENGETRLVFGLYEPIHYLNDVLIRNSIAPVAVPAVVLALLIALSYKLANRAQEEINQRTDQVNALRERLESLVSRDAVAAVRNATGSTIASSRTEETLFYSDIRDFTGFSETHEPEEVIDFLNQLMALQIDLVKDRNGDVDKMVGDALLVRFSGEDKETRALEAAEAIQRAMRKAGFQRSIGIGLYTGQVIAGAIGPDDRRDYTVIGDSVNVSARLCSAAQAGQVVLDGQTAIKAGLDLTGREETIQVKGRTEALHVTRLIP